MRLPFEIIQIIYNYSDIDTKQLFNKIYKHESFLHNKIIISYSDKMIFNQINSFKHSNYILIRELSNTFLFV